MRLAVGSDHAGLALKQQLVEHCKKAGHDVEDVGTHTDASCDYPDFALAVSQRVVDGKADLGLLVCGTGIGMSMTANKVSGIRAAVLSEPFSARMAREHNDANVLCLGGRFTAPALAHDMVKAWLTAECQGDRHRRRVKKIADLEKR
jgi:ribose 5-phosphate isomerase B